MSGTNVNITQLEQNWTGLVALGNQAIGNVKLECKAPAPRDIKLYFNFDIECAGKNSGRPCGGHVSLQHAQNPAHLALMGWDGARKTHYWFAFEKNGTLRGRKGARRHVVGHREYQCCDLHPAEGDRRPDQAHGASPLQWLPLLNW